MRLVWVVSALFKLPGYGLLSDISCIFDNEVDALIAVGSIYSDYSKEEPRPAFYDVEGLELNNIELCSDYCQTYRFDSEGKFLPSHSYIR